MKRAWTLTTLAIVTLGCLNLQVYAQPSQPATQPANNSAADVVDKMMKRLKKTNKPIEPTQRPAAAKNARPALSPRPQIDVDPKILGVAPGMPQPKLRREGEFVINRRGRLVRANDGNNMLFIFKSDSQHAPEPPMIIVPCQLLQNMEQMVLNRGDHISFSLTGQILTYHGANYLLPTMMKPAIDMGNLQN